MKRFIKFLILLIIITPVCYGFECHDHLKYGLPGNANQFLCRDGYAVGYNYLNKVADWVAYKINHSSVDGGVGRQNSFIEDEDIPLEYRSLLTDYYKSGFDRGHLAPSATMDYNIQSAKESYLLSNMAPQLPGLNRQGWKYLEQHIRDWTSSRKDLYVVTGSLYETDMGYIGNHVKIPSHFFKVIYDEKNHDAIAFIMPNKKISKAEVPRYIVSVDEVELRSGLDFNSLLPDEIENDIEDDIETLWH